MAAEIHKKCTICLDRIDKKYILTTCNHTFHDKCFDEYIKYSDKDKSYILCPLCRNELDLKTKEYEGDYKLINLTKTNKNKFSKKEEIFLNKKLNEYIKEQIDIFGLSQSDIDCDDFVEELKILEKQLPFKINYKIQKENCLEYIKKK